MSVRMLLRVAAVVSSVALAGGFVAHQSGCSWFSGREAAPVAGPAAGGQTAPQSGQSQRMLISGSKSAPVFTQPGTLTPSTQRVLLPGSKSADITRGGTTAQPNQAAQQQAVQQPQAVQQQAARQGSQ